MLWHLVMVFNMPLPVIWSAWQWVLTKINTWVWSGSNYLRSLFPAIQRFLLFCTMSRRILENIVVNAFQPSVMFHTETSHLFCSLKQMTGFYMKCNTGLKWVNGSWMSDWVEWVIIDPFCSNAPLFQCFQFSAPLPVEYLLHRFQFSCGILERNKLSETTKWVKKLEFFEAINCWLLFI